MGAVGVSHDDEPGLFSAVPELELVRALLADLHDDLRGKVSRFNQLTELSQALGADGTLLPGGETAYAAWLEARTSFIHGNYIATVMLCQSLAEHMLAGQLVAFGRQGLPERVSFHETLSRCVAQGYVGETDAADLRRLMSLRNPLSHYRDINDSSNLSRRALNSREPVQEHLMRDASFAISMAVRLLALPSFRLG